MASFARSCRFLCTLLILCGALSLATAAHASAPKAIAPQPLITQQIDNTNLVPLTGNVHPLATAAADQGAAPETLQLGRTILVLKRSSAQEAQLQKLLAAQQNPSSSNYHRWLSPAQFGAQFGVATQDIEKITQWLASFGFAVEKPMPGQNVILFSGTHAQLKAAFHTELHNYKVNGRSYWANATDPQIPAALAPVIAGFSSLNNFPRKAMHTAPQAIHKDASSGKWSARRPAPATSKLHPAFTTTDQGTQIYPIVPYDLATIYNIKPLWDAGIDGTGETIAIVSDSDINTADIDYFRQTFGLPAKNLNVIYDGANPGLGENEGEADLDVQWAGAVAKNATIDLVVAPDTATSAGIDSASLYIVSNNLASLLNVSYGACELALGTGGNQFYNEIWQQAAAQGITVLTSTGDSGSAGCDDQEPYAEYGLAVSGVASTPYSVAVGGTDFYSTFTSPSTYWSQTNDPTTLASVKSYLPETTWNDSCASPEVFSTLQSEGDPDATPEAVCNDANVQSYFLTTAGGSGGVSACTTSDGQNTSSCKGGNPKPVWQTGVPGIPSDGVRDLPDVALMAGDGLWGSFYVFCESDATDSGQCDLNSDLEGAGGTSFASPIFAGMMALVQQKTGLQQGNANYMLYKLAAAQYAGPNANACTSDGAASGNACTFYDVTDGTIAMPCVIGSTNCNVSVRTDQYGTLPGYPAGAGYDTATGLGSVNAYNLVENWATAATSLSATTTTLTADTTTVAYGADLPLSVSVAAQDSSSGTPTGDVGITSDIPGSAAITEATLSNGQASTTTSLLSVGAYHLVANYPGDATFSPSKSTSLAITVTPATIAGATATATRTTLQSGQQTSIFVTLPGVPYGAAPTGTVVFTDATSGSTISTVSVTQSGASTATPSSSAFVTVSASQLHSGANNISAAYSGDGNYNPITLTAPSLTVGESFTAAANPGTLTLAPQASGTAAITVTPSGSSALTPSALTFACPASLPAGLTCSFSQPVAAAGGAVTSTLTLTSAAPLTVAHSTVAANRSGDSWLRVSALTSLAGLFVLVLPRRRKFLLSIVAALGIFAWTVGCGGGGSHSTPPPSLIATTTTLASSSAQPPLNSAVTLTASVAAGSGSGSPSGTITFSSASSTLGTASLANGTATLTTSSLPLGAQNVTAAYGGDSTYAASSSSAVAVDVTYSTTLAITVSDTAGDSSNANLAVNIQ